MTPKHSRCTLTALIGAFLLLGSGVHCAEPATRVPPAMRWKGPALDLLPDGEAVWSESRQSWAFLCEPDSTTYAHGILGDGIEARTVVVTGPEGQERWRHAVPAGQVIEDRRAHWGDSDGDGRDEVTLVTSDAQQGASLLVLDGATGAVLTRGGAIGTGYRWQHVLGWVRPGKGAPVLVLVRTPHIAPIIMVFQVEGGSLVERSRLGGYTSHRIGSRNLDEASLVPWQGAWAAELPDQAWSSRWIIPLRDGPPWFGQAVRSTADPRSALR